MANFCGMGRSNYFRVNDNDKFREFCGRYELEFWNSEKEPDLVAFYTNGEGGFDNCYINEAGDPVDGDIEGELAKLLVPGEVAVLMSIGNEKMRYLDGYAVAINSDGFRKAVNLTDIYKKAKLLTTKTEAISLCSY